MNSVLLSVLLVCVTKSQKEAEGTIDGVLGFTDQCLLWKEIIYRPIIRNEKFPHDNKNQLASCA